MARVHPAGLPARRRSLPSRWILRLIAAAAALASLPAAPARAAKTDVIILRNGDHLTGELKELARGKLTFETDDAGTVAIEWDKVKSVTATATFEVDDLDGGQYFGALRPATKD